uniref:Putative lipopolysaccharide biosynthesis O-acetyl transferase WbbJ n=1 Tax=Sphingobacterium sp. (strain 21) TaxID=743722 RepID=F4C880_SPHS2
MFRKYGLGGSIRMLFHLLRTRLFYSRARLIRFPFELRNHRYIDLGKGLTTGVGCRLEALPQAGAGKMCIRLGTNVQLNDYVHIGAIEQISIGNEVLIASKVFITDHNHGSFDAHTVPEEIRMSPISRPLYAKPVNIGDRCWLGENVVILPGVSLGEGCVVGASAVVTKSFPPYSLIIGNPARLYKRFNLERQQWELA